MNSNGRDDKRDDKRDKANAKADSKEGKLLAKAELSRAKAAKRKWLVFLIIAAVGAYFLLKGGISSGLIESIKSKLGM